jgi:hypothetical protein
VTSDDKGPLKIETAVAIRVNSDGEGDFYESNEEDDQLRAKDLSPQRPKSKDDDLVGGKFCLNFIVFGVNFKL